MQLVMLSGNSLQNREWIHRVDQELDSMFAMKYVQDYRHWETGDSWIDLEHELSVLKEQSKNLQEPYGIFAKSIGTVLAIEAVRRGTFSPQFLLLCGVPLNYIIENNFQFSDELRACNVPISIIHNEYDVVGSAAELKKYLEEDLASKVITTPGETHNYEDYNLLRAELSRLKGTA